MHIDLTTALKIAVILGIILWFSLAWKFGGRARDSNGGFGGGGGGDVGGHGGHGGDCGGGDACGGDGGGGH